jgi:hypothetical protein
MASGAISAKSLQRLRGHDEGRERADIAVHVPEKRKSITCPRGERVQMGRAAKKERWAAHDGE